ncbi:hypothetical protein [Kribbella jiaozuonensis]|uniref:Uncharacterized protein n=1 Tax=Kribbella jiaozuonensis TaxID=2575441 RepID=A0A4U3M2P5_9ACTN|nr:hypothetical protein [Kribbella jiaozuonensis]TKK81536.1 hypothetical protein FDA38_01405 [Kribbella jiaozuonensis]
MKALTGLLWVVTLATGFYGTVKGVSEKAHATGKSFWRVFFSGQENFIWHSAPGWYYPVLIALTVVTVAVTAWYFFSRD